MNENEQHREESWNKLVQKLKKHEFPLLDYNALVDTLRDIDMILDHTEGNEKKIKEIEAIVYKTLQRSVQPQHTTKETSEPAFSEGMLGEHQRERHRAKNYSEKSEEERIREIMYKKLDREVVCLNIEDAAKAIKEYYHTEIIELLKKENEYLNEYVNVKVKEERKEYDRANKLQKRIEELEKELANRTTK